MSVKQKLFLSNIMMFSVPVLAYAVFSYIADRLSWQYLLDQTFYSFEQFRSVTESVQRVARICTVAALFVTLLLLNTLLSRGILKRIRDSLSQLSEGLRQLRQGNRSFRLQETDNDEFVTVRSDFNSMASQLQQSVERVEQNERNRKELLAGISHDLRSPLTSIRAYAEGLLDGVPRTEEDKMQYLTTIRDKTADLQKLVNKLFLFSRIDMGQNEDHPEKLDVAAELNELCSAIAPEYEDKGLHIVCSSEGEANVMADPDTIHRIVINIVENSCKYKLSEEGNLHIHTVANDKYVSIRFTDDGHGVAPEAIENIFDAFYRADPSRNGKISGSGLGLAIVSRAVRNMNGVIIARNVQPHGLELEIQLPILEASV